jgi:hypothetical protein
LSTKAPLLSPCAPFWFYTFVSVYAVAGYFAGNEHSRLAGVALTTLGLGIGWFVAAKLATSTTKAKALALVVPIGLAGWLAVMLAPSEPHGLRVKRAALEGTWASQGTSTALTVRLQGDSAWLSQAAGLQNVAYQAAVRHDSLVLVAEGVADPLRWRIAQDTTLHRLVLVAGEGIYFLKTTPK